MYSIGQFSKICSVSVKTLRHYDAIGLLKPAFTDPQSGYRYYTADQTGKLLLVSRLKRYGFSLAQIQRILLTEDQQALFQTLSEQRHALQAQQVAAQHALRELEEHLQNFERTGSIMAYQDRYDVSLVERKAQPILSARQMMSMEDFGRYFGGVMEQIATKKLTVVGDALSIYHDEDFNPDHTDVELGFPIAEEKEASRVLPGGLHASTVHTGSYASLPDSYAAITHWVEDNGYALAGPPFEFYEKSNMSGTPVEEWKTTIYFPVKKG